LNETFAIPLSVIPGLTRNPGNTWQYWIPAFAGMTKLLVFTERMLL
jgi:hypothetical protein